MAQTVSDTLLLSWLKGHQAVADKAATALARADNLPPPPVDWVDTLPMPEGDDPIIEFPVIQEAARSLAERRVLTSHAFHAQNADAQQRAFTVARLASEDAIEKLQDALVSNIRDGGTLKEFREKAEEAIGKSALAPHHLEGIFRTNTARAYAEGQDRVLAYDLVGTAFPYRWEIGIRDSRRTDICERVTEGGLNNTGVYRADDPTWQRLRSIRHWQCRCTTSPITIEQAAEMGVEEAIRWAETGLPPERPEWVSMPGVQLPKGWSPGGGIA